MTPEWTLASGKLEQPDFLKLKTGETSTEERMFSGYIFHFNWKCPNPLQLHIHKPMLAPVAIIHQLPCPFFNAKRPRKGSP